MLGRKGSGRDESCISPEVLLDVTFSLPSFRFFTEVALDITLAPNISLVIKPFPFGDGVLLLLPERTWARLFRTLGLRAETEGGRDIRRSKIQDWCPWTGQLVQQLKLLLWISDFTFYSSDDRPVALKRRGHLVFVWTEQFGLHFVDLCVFKLQFSLQRMNLHKDKDSWLLSGSEMGFSAFWYLVLTFLLSSFSLSHCSFCLWLSCWMWFCLCVSFSCWDPFRASLRTRISPFFSKISSSTSFS